MERVYFDNSATTRTDDEVIEAMLPFMREEYGNASSLHGFGKEAKKALQEGREKVGALIGAEPSEIIFTSGGTESDNLAIKGFAMANRKKGKHIITSSIEHHAVFTSCEFLEKNGFEITKVPVNSDGIVDISAFESAIRDDTIFISIMNANNEIGTIQPIERLAEMAAEKGISFHTDAVQSAGHIPIDAKKMNVSMLSLSAHKFYGPKGVGALYLKKGIRIDPLFHGGGHERGLRSSTENIPGIVGMGKAAELAQKNMGGESERLTRLRDIIIDDVLRLVPRTHLNGHRTLRLPNNVHLRFDFIEGESLVLFLDMKGFAVSTGSACSTKSLEPSHVLLALGLHPEEAHGSMRLTLSKYNTEDEVRSFVDVLPEVVSKLREMSPYNEDNPMNANEPWCSINDQHSERGE